jgi:hypothetical protein
MCYNSEMSFAFATIGALSLAYIYSSKNQITTTGIQYILIFYTIMELLQGIQYFFVNQCSNMVNILLTEFAYILVLLQPLMWNLFYYFNSTESDKKMFLVAIVSFIVWMISDVYSRFMYDKIDINKTKQTGFFASDKVCTKKQKTHLYWKWTSANLGEMNATFLSYLMIWFIPALFSTKFRSTSIIIMVLAAFSALVAKLNNEFFTFASLWCFISVPIVFCVILNFMFYK